MQPLHTLCRRIGNFVLLFGAMPDLHYINGPDTLPPPLTPQEEQQALCGLAAGEGAARDALITHNLRLVVYIAKKFESSTAGVEDMISIGTIGLIKAVNTFEPGKNIKLATYASRCIENEILMYLRKSSNRRQDASIDEPLNTDSDGNELLLSDSVRLRDRMQAAGVPCRLEVWTDMWHVFQMFPIKKAGQAMASVGRFLLEYT